LRRPAPTVLNPSNHWEIAPACWSEYFPTDDLPMSNEFFTILEIIF
jgi:hypothetical protein